MYFAVPSWVIPGTIAQNAFFLQNRAKEIGLCFFEWKACLNYDDRDLPEWLGALPCHWHVHMPLDLPWNEGAETVAEICERLTAKIINLRPRFMVLHPPRLFALTLLKNFSTCFRNVTEAEILIENISNSTAEWANEEFLSKYGFGFCLDLAHALLNPKPVYFNMASSARLAHWSAPGINDAHRPLTELEERQKTLLKELCQRFSPKVTHMLEIFSWPEIEASLPIMTSLTEDLKGD